MNKILTVSTLAVIFFSGWIAAPALALSDRDQAQAHYHQGDDLIDGGKFEEAVKEFKESIRLNPNHFESHNNLGFVYSQMGRYWEAVNEYRQGVRIRPDNAVVQNNLGFMYNKLGLYEDAIQHLKESILLDP